MEDFNLNSKITGLLENLRTVNVTRLQPFTHRDGFTFLELLEKMRALMLEIVDYVNNFGDMSDEKLGVIDGLITALSNELDTMVTNVKNSFNDYKTELTNTSGELETLKAQNLEELENLRNEVQTLINEFKNKILTSGFTLSGGTVSAPLIGGGSVDIYTKDGVSTALQEAINTVEELRITIREENNKPEPDLTPFLRKDDALRNYEPKHKKPVAVFIGSSNAVNDTSWTRELSGNMGFEYHNFAVSGGSFTGQGDGTFIGQTRRAVHQLQTVKNDVTHFFVMDLLNDVRADNDVENRAREVFSLVRSTFPNARIIVLPVVLNRDNLNKNTRTYRSVAKRTSEVQSAGLPYRVEVIQGSQSWLWGEDSESGSTDQVNGVHLKPAGYEIIRQWVEIYLNGGYTWRNYGWRNLSDYSQPVVDRSQSNFAISRYENFVTIHGTIRLNDRVGTDSVLCNIPAWAFNTEAATFFAPTSDRSANKAFYINPLGQLVSRDNLDAGVIMSVDVTYRLW